MNPPGTSTPRGSSGKEAARSQGGESSPFAISPHALATPLLVAFNISFFIGLLADGMPVASSKGVEQLLAWGGNFGPLTLSGEWWRLIVCTFLHGSFLHLAPNLLGLWFGGSLLERHIGSANFLAIYLASAAASGLASLAWSPGGVAFGASGAILGVFGALAIFSFHEPDFVQPPPTISPFALALSVILGTVALGLLTPSIDQAGHLGGFTAGCVLAVALGRFTGSSRPERSGIRLAMISFGFLLFLFIATASLPRHIVTVENEFLRFEATQKYLVDQFNGASSANEGDGLDLVAFRDRLLNQILPRSRGARARIEILENLPRSFEEHRRTILAAALRREERFESLADQFTRVQAALTQLGQLEQQIAIEYANTQESYNEQEISADAVAAILFDQAVDSWSPLIANMESQTGLTPPLRRRLNVLRDYAVLRQQAWDLFAWSIRNNDPGLAASSQERHRQASKMISGWIEK